VQNLLSCTLSGGDIAVDTTGKASFMQLLCGWSGGLINNNIILKHFMSPGELGKTGAVWQVRHPFIATVFKQRNS